MADWEYAPREKTIERLAPPVLIDTFDDGTEIRRVKASQDRRRFIERHVTDKTTMDAMLDFYETKSIMTKFTILTDDANELTTATATVRFETPPVVSQSSDNRYECTFVFIELPGE